LRDRRARYTSDGYESSSPARAIERRRTQPYYLQLWFLVLVATVGIALMNL